MLTLIQIKAIITLLVAFGVPQITVTNVENILTHKNTETVSQPATQPVPTPENVTTPTPQPPIVPVFEKPILRIKREDTGFTLTQNATFTLVGIDVNIPDASNIRNITLRSGTESFGTKMFPENGINSFTPSGGFIINATTTFTVTADGMLYAPDITIRAIDPDGFMVKL